MLQLRISSRALRSLLLTVLTIVTWALLAGSASAQQCDPCWKWLPPDPGCGSNGSSGEICVGKCVPDDEMEGQRCGGSDGKACDPPRYCNSGFCAGGASENTICRPSTGACDVAEKCKSEFSFPNPKYSCPADRLKAEGTECRAATGSCDTAETCDGDSAQCPADVVTSAGTVCRSSAGLCDVAESCDGSSGKCPTDVVVSAGVECRGSAGVCDVAETCNGTSPACPTNTMVSAGTVCRGAAGVCDAVETCSGSAATCPVDAFRPKAIICRGVSGICDVSETCTGSGVDCPADVFKGAETICRDSVGQCDPGEVCGGDAKDCPADERLAAGTACTADGDSCTVDACDGTGRCAHTFADGDDDGACDAKDPCTNVAGGRDFAAKSKTAFAKVDTQMKPDDDELTLRASFDLPAEQSFSSLSPDTHGARLLITSAAGEQIVDVSLATGAYGGRGTRGWSRSKSGKVWTFADATGDPANGIIKFKISDKSGKKTPQRASIVITGKNGDYPVLAGDAPLEVAITLGDQADAAAGLCAESSYATEDCTANPKGDRISCTR